MLARHLHARPDTYAEHNNISIPLSVSHSFSLCSGFIFNILFTPKMLRQQQKTQHNITLQTAKLGAQKKASRQKADEVRVGDWAKGHGRQDLRAGL